MNEEIKEILDNLRFSYEQNKELYEKYNQDVMRYIIHLKEAELLLDYITNLQEELEDLRESDWAWHQTLKAQNKREYRSKFLKEFQQEYNTNTFPDYDEIYKRYDKLKKENEKLKERCEYLQRSCNRKEEERDYARMEYMEQEDYKSRNEKAIKYIEKCRDYHKTYHSEDKMFPDELTSLIIILQGDDKDE